MLNKKAWADFSDDEMADYQDRVFRHYREQGFPYYPTDHTWRQREFIKLKNFNYGSLIDENGHIKQTMHGLALAWSYMPHSFNVRCGSLKTPYEAFNDDKLLRLTIKKRVRYGDNMSDAGMRKMLRMVSGVQGVSNFRPTAAAALYDKFAPGGAVWDMSCGYGGRMLGFEISKAEVYWGCDPATDTMAGLQGIRRDFITKPVSLMKQGSEVTRLDKGSIDFAFTSPPYFNWEKYSDEPSQSYLKYPTLYSWKYGFLRDTLLNSFNSLREGGHCAINIADTKAAPGLEESCVKIAKDIGFTHVDTMGLKLSAMKNGYKVEPIFIFQKQ